MEQEIKNALRLIKDYCNSVDINDCSRGKCPLHEWCESYMTQYVPGDWELEGNYES